MVDLVIEPAEGIRLPGQLLRPDGASGVVVFAHGSGSSRLSPRNLQVARTLGQGGLATLLFDLLTPREAQDRRYVFDIRLLGERLVAAGEVAAARTGLPLGYFGASTGAAAALWAAAEGTPEARAVVSRGGRPDLAGPRLPEVTAPTLLIVGGGDRDVLELNRQAQARLRCPNELRIVEEAGHLFEEPGTLEQVADLATDWFARHLRTT